MSNYDPMHPLSEDKELEDALAFVANLRKKEEEENGINISRYSVRPISAGLFFFKVLDFFCLIWDNTDN